MRKNREKGRRIKKRKNKKKSGQVQQSPSDIIDFHPPNLQVVPSTPGLVMSSSSYEILYPHIRIAGSQTVAFVIESHVECIQFLRLPELPVLTQLVSQGLLYSIPLFVCQSVVEPSE